MQALNDCGVLPLTVRIDVDREEGVGSNSREERRTCTFNESWMFRGESGTEMKMVDTPLVEQPIPVVELDMTIAQMRAKIIPLDDLSPKQLPTGLLCWWAPEIIGYQ